MAQSPLSMRCEIVKALVQKNFSHLPDLEQRRMETTILQILAPIYAPPRSATPVPVESIFSVALEAKNSIDDREKENRPQLLRPIAMRPQAPAPPTILNFPGT